MPTALLAPQQVPVFACTSPVVPGTRAPAAGFVIAWRPVVARELPITHPLISCGWVLCLLIRREATGNFLSSSLCKYHISANRSLIAILDSDSFQPKLASALFLGGHTATSEKCANCPVPGHSIGQAHTLLIHRIWEMLFKHLRPHPRPGKVQEPIQHSILTPALFRDHSNI